MGRRSVIGRTGLFLVSLLWITGDAAADGITWEFLARFGELPSRGGGELYYPSGVAVDSASGDVFVADSLNQQIQRFTADGQFLNKWGFTAGIGLAVDPADGSVYVGSLASHQMYRFDPQGNQLAVWGGKGTGDGQFDKPRHAAVNPVSGNLFVLDSVNRRVQEFTPTGDFVQSWDYDSTLYNPYGIAIDPTGSFVWIANTGSLLENVRKYDTNGNLLLTFGSVGSAAGEFRWPRGIAVDATGNIYVADTDMERVQKFDADGNFLQTFKGPETDSAGPAHPRAIAVNQSTGDIYTAAAYSNRIDHFDASGTFLGSWGHHDRDGFFLSSPKGLAADPVNQVLFVADTMSHLIKKFSFDGQFLGQYGNWPFVHRDETAVSFPAALSTDADGNYWALNEGIIYPDDPSWGSDKFVRRFDSDGNYLSGIAHPDFTAEMGGLVVNKDAQELYVSNTRKHKVMRFGFDGAFLGEWGSKGAESGQFRDPAGVALDPIDDTLLVVDAGNQRIQRFGPDGTFLMAFGGAGTAPGQFRFAAYSGIAVDAKGNIFVADTANHRVQVFSRSGESLAVIGSQGSGAGRFRSPIGVALAGDLLFVLETSGREVEVVRISDNTPPPDPVETVWVEDAVPAGAVQAGDWNFVDVDPSPFSGELAHQSELAAGLHQHYFYLASDRLAIESGDTLFAYVYLDPANPPTEVMLEWRGGGSWNHRAYWGADRIEWGTNGTSSRRYMGPLPSTGGWVRLAVAASEIDLEGRSVDGMAFTLYDGRATWDRAGKSSGETLPPPPAPAESVWVEDAVPSGAVQVGLWDFRDTDPAPFSGNLAHQSQLVLGLHQHYFYNASDRLTVGTDDSLFAYVFLDPENPPTEVMLEWRGGGSWNHRAYWGADRINWGTNGTASRRYMGPLPAVGGWVRLVVEASDVDLEDRSVDGMAFTLFDGRATWDRAGKSSGEILPPPPATAESVWVEDAVPAGAVQVGDWDFVNSDPLPFSGDLAHLSRLTAGLHQHYFYLASDRLAVEAGDTLFAYVYLDPDNPPTEVMLEWRAGGTWGHRAYWGADRIGWGTNGTASRRFIGPLPSTAGWVRLEVPAEAVGLEGLSVDGMAFTLYDGRASWDRAGKSFAQAGQ